MEQTERKDGMKKPVIEPVTRLDRQLKYTGTILKIYEDTVIANGHEAHWDFIHHDGAAAVIPVTDEGKILMVRQFRNALNRETLEIPAGKRDDPHEPTIQCAYREQEEETGYRCQKIEKLLTIRTTVAFCNEKIDIYLATDLQKTMQHLDEDEFVNVEIYTIEELEQMIYDGTIEDAKTIAAILAYKNKEQ